MTHEHPPYDEKKATQAAALLLQLNGRPMKYMKLVKLLYNIDREALRRWGRAITYDEPFSLRHGLILSQTLDLAEEESPPFPSYWADMIKTEGYEASLIGEASTSELTEAEIELIGEWFQLYRDRTAMQMAREHHNHELFPEWQDPGYSRIPTSLLEILRAVGFSEEQAEEILNGIDEDAALTRRLRS
jgi:hypothetical protein